MEFKYKNANESPGFLFWQVYMIWKRKINSKLKELDITHTQYVILAVTHYIEMTGKKVTQINISEMSKIDTMTISGSARILEKKGYLKREIDEKDTRAKVVRCTDEGMKILNKATNLIESIDEDFFAFSEQKEQEFFEILEILLNKGD